MGQCMSSSSNGGVAPEPPAPVRMTFTIRISNKRKADKISRALIRLWANFEGVRASFSNNADGMVMSMTGNFFPGTVQECLHKYARYVEIQHLDNLEAV